MFRLDRALKPYRESGSLNDQVNLFGFIDDGVFLTKSGDVGLILAVKGVDYEGLAAVPGNCALNVRQMLITNANYADYSLLFTLHAGDRENRHLRREHLAILETNHKTLYFFNLHSSDTAHTLILGRTRA